MLNRLPQNVNLQWEYNISCSNWIFIIVLQATILLRNENNIFMYFSIKQFDVASTELICIPKRQRQQQR